MGSNEAQTILITTLYIIVMLVALAGNSLLIYIVWKKPTVRSLTSFMFVNMAVADLLVTLVMMPWSIAHFYTGSKWLITGTLGDITCRGVIFVAYVTVIASILCLAFIAANRFYAVVYPLRRHVWFRKAKILTPLIWIVSMALMSIIPLSYHLDASYSACVYTFEIWGDEKAAIRGVFLYIFAISYFLPLIVASILYAKTAHKLWFHQAPGHQLIQNQQQLEIKKKKVVRNLIVIFTVFALCWLPAQVYHLFVAITAWEVVVPNLVMYLFYWLGHANSAINPWLYIGLNSKMRLHAFGMIPFKCVNVGNADANTETKANTRSTMKESLV